MRVFVFYAGVRPEQMLDPDLFVMCSTLATTAPDVSGTATYDKGLSMLRFLSVFLLCLVLDKPAQAETSPYAEQEAQEALDDGRFLKAHRLYQQILAGKKGVPPTQETHYLAARAAFGAGYYTVAKGLIQQYLDSTQADRLFESEAHILVADIQHALDAFSTSDMKAFEFAQSQHTIFAYAAYRDRYPEGTNIEAADFLSFRRAKEVNVEVSYKRYLEHWPDGKFATEARRSADQAAFKEARQKNLEETYLSYLTSYPNGTFRDQARLRLEAIAFSKAQRDGSVEAIKQFLARHPSGQYGAEARLLLARAEQQRPLRDLVGATATISPGSILIRNTGSNTGNNGSSGKGKVVAIPAPLLAMRHEVTFNMWDRCVEEGGCNAYSPPDEGWGRHDRPVIHVSKADIRSFISWLNNKWLLNGGTGLWRLPSEAEWSYMAQGLAARSINVQAAFSSVAEACAACAPLPDPDATFPVGQFRPNSFGLYDMFGNVAEWVADCWHGDRSAAPDNGAAHMTEACNSGVVKGATDSVFPSILAAQAREQVAEGARNKSIGFRLVLTQAKQQGQR